MPAPNTRGETLAWYQREAAHPSQSWKGLCLASVHTAWGIPALFGTAYAAWLGADPEDRHPGGNPEDAPLGAALCWKGTNPAGHIATKARPFRTSAAVWSNDLVTVGAINKAPVTWPRDHWGQTYLGYLTAVNGWDLNLGPAAKPDARPKPKQARKYAAIQTAADHLENAIHTAKGQHDQADVDALNKELARLHDLYARLRRA